MTKPGKGLLVNDRRRLVVKDPRPRWLLIGGILLVGGVALVVLIWALVNWGSDAPTVPVPVIESSSVSLTPTTAPVSAPETANVPVQSGTVAGPLTSFGSGVWEVGADIETGKYKTAGPKPGSGLCSWTRRARTGEPPDDVIASGNSEGPATVTVKASDGIFESRGCQNWTKVA